MCANCVAQGVVYVGGALAGLQVMSARVRARRHASGDGNERGPAETEPAERHTAGRR